jgi:pimeloyl-ACP methyl ester carboxylesterase
LDQSGLGDSAPRPGKERDVIRPPEAFDDVAETAAALEPGDPTNVILLGLCSGAYQALESALLQPVRAAYAINPTLHFTPPEMADGPMDPRRRICWPAHSFVSTYRVLMIEPVRRHLRKAIWRVLHLFNRDPEREASGWLDQLRGDGVEVLIVCGEDEARPFGAAAEATTVRELGDPIRIDLIGHLDGALMPAVQRREVAHRLTEHLVAHFAQHRAASVSRRDTA